MKNPEIKQEASMLVDLLRRSLSQMEKITKMYSLSNDLRGVEKDEFNRLIRLCEGSYRDDIDRLRWWINYLMLERIEGKLRYESNDRYTLQPEDFEFHCGSSIEVYNDGEWHFGRVEYDHDPKSKCHGYYFCGSHNFALKPGMKAAIRRNTSIRD